MLIIFMFLLIPSIFHLTTSKALNKINNNNNSLTILHINNSEQHDLTPSSSFSPVTLHTTTILQQDVKSKINNNGKNENIKPPPSNRYRRNVNDLMENAMYPDPNYNVVVDVDRNFPPQIPSADWDSEIFSRNRRNLIGRSPLSEEFSGMQILNSVNLSGRREQPFYVEEPQYISVRRQSEYPELIETGEENELFIPPRGRKSANMQKKSSGLNNLFGAQNSDLFMPNRGKKTIDTADHYKRAKYNDVLFGDDLFFPNRGKKMFKRNKVVTSPTSSVTQLLGNDDFFYPNRGKKSRLTNILAPNELFYPNRGKKMSANTYAAAYNNNNGGGGGAADLIADLDFFVPWNRGEKNLLINKREILLNDKKHGNKSTTITATPTTNINNNNSKNNNNNNNNNNNDNKGDRYKRDLLDNLSKEKDTFYSARGRRNNNNNNNSINNNGERNNGNNNNNNSNEKFMEENNKNFLDDKFYTSNEILKRSSIKNLKNDYGITDDSRLKSFDFLKQIPTMFGMAGADEMPTTRFDQQIINQQQPQQEPILSLINADTTYGGGDVNRDMDSSTDFTQKYIWPRYFDYMARLNAQSNYRK